MTCCNVIRLILALAATPEISEKRRKCEGADARDNAAPMKKAAAFFSGPAGKITLRRAMHLSPGASESMTQLWIFVESKAHAR